MPRKRQTQAGMPAQAVSPVGGQMYGAGVEQAALQQAMPAPQLQGASLPATNPMQQATAPPAGQPPAAPPMPAADQFAALMASAQQLKGQAGLLTAPSARPGEPVTAGLSLGPGPGTEALQARTGSPIGESWRRLSAATGDPYFAELARKANL